jgi:formiminotetrahydrofolate cyclodeaminase
VAAPSRDIAATTVEAFLDRLADASPTPAGGSAVALVTATAAALVAMVARVALARTDAAAVREIVADADRCRRQALGLASQDVEAYTALVTARRAGAGVAGALAHATETPLAVARASGLVLDLAAALAPHARPATRSDLGVAVALAHATLHGAAQTARANLHDVPDGTFAERVESELARIVDTGEAARVRVHAAFGAGS